MLTITRGGMQGVRTNTFYPITVQKQIQMFLDNSNMANISTDSPQYLSCRALDTHLNRTNFTGKQEIEPSEDWQGKTR